MHLIKLSDRMGGDPLHRTHEQRIANLADIREFVAHLNVALLRANRLGQEVYVEIWEDFYEPKTREEVVNNQSNGTLAKS